MDAGAMSSSNVYRDICGLYLSPVFREPIIKEALAYKPKPGDVFIVSYPKCGTTWVQSIVYAIYNDGILPKDLDGFMKSAPFLEMLGREAVETMPRPGAIKTHLPFTHHPYSRKAKYIYVTRNPYDCCVSFYHHTKSIPACRFAEQPFEKFFDLFMEGKVSYGDYFDHQLSWYEHINDDNVLIVTYEDLHMHPRPSVLKIAHFLGENYGRKLQEQHQVLETILDAISVNTMKGLNQEFKNWTAKAVEITSKEQKYGGTPDEVLDDLKKPLTGDFVRKGVVGDWKNYFTSEQVSRMKERIELKTKGSTLMNLWKDNDFPK